MHSFRLCVRVFVLVPVFVSESVCVCVSLSVYQSVSLSVYQSVSLLVSQPLSLLISQPLSLLISQAPTSSPTSEDTSFSSVELVMITVGSTIFLVGVLLLTAWRYQQHQLNKLEPWREEMHRAAREKYSSTIWLSTRHARYALDYACCSV